MYTIKNRESMSHAAKDHTDRLLSHEGQEKFFLPGDKKNRPNTTSESVEACTFLMNV